MRVEGISTNRLNSFSLNEFNLFVEIPSTLTILISAEFHARFQQFSHSSCGSILYLQDLAFFQVHVLRELALSKIV